MRVDQIGLLLWKNYIVRKRQPGILALVFIWPVAVFMILYTIRDNVDPKYYPTCQFPARSMPQNGLLPFVQSFICSLGNPCDPLTEYEEVPSYKNATLGSLVIELQPMLGNETILSAVRTLPNSIQLLKSMAQILTRPEIKALFDRGIRLGDLFNNHEEIKNLLQHQMPYARQGLIDELLRSSIKLIYLIEAFGSSNIDEVICSPENLKKYLILPKPEDYEGISKILCDIESETIPKMLENLSKHLDFSGLLEMVDRAMATFRDYDFFEDLKRAVETILDLQTVKKNVPDYLRLRQWLPKMIMAFKNVTFKEIDLTFMNKSLAILEPVFSTERDWPIARRAFIRIQRFLELVKGMKNERNNDQNSEDFFTIIARLKGSMQAVSLDIGNNENLTRILDLSVAILHDGAKLTSKIFERHVDEIQLSAEILDGLKDFLSDNVLATLSYILSFMQAIVKMIHHAAIIHEDVPYRIYNISLNHKDTVQKLLTNVDPNVYRTFVRSFSRLNFVEKFVEKVRRTRPEDFFCQEETLNEIFENFKDSKDQSSYVKELLCSNSGKKLIADVYDAFELKKFENIVSDSLSVVVSLVLKQVIDIEKSNLTSVVKSVKGLVSYLESPVPPEPDWSVFQSNEVWTRVFEETEAQGRLNVLGVHLSIAKMIGSRSLTYATIRPDLENMDTLAEIILQDLKENPTSWIGEVRRQKAQLIQSFYLTAIDKDKALKILEYDNFTRTYCTDPNPPALLNFPKGSNETVLKSLVCRLSKSVQTDLELNMTEIELRKNDRYWRKGSFNFTDFNAKTIEIYRYIDTLVHQKDSNYDLANLKKLNEDFKTAWGVDVSAKDIFELSVGLICKFFSVMESSLFRTKGGWKEMHAMGWASSVIFDNVERIVDQIQRNDHVAKLSEVLQDMSQTEILLSAILRNLSPLILDVVDIITMKPIHLISVLDDYKSREEQWPCIQNESVGSAMELRNGTREIVREIERISCNPALFIKEWREQPVLTRARKIFQHDDTVQLPPFNWTLGYGKFRRLAKKMDYLMNDAKEVVLAEQPHLWEHLESLVPEVKSILNERLPDVKNDARSTLEYIDMELDKTVSAFQSNLSANGVWKPMIAIEDRILVLSKFLSHVVRKTTRTMSQILRDATESISPQSSKKLNLLPLLGFNKRTPIAIYYDQLPYILATLVNGLSDPEVDNNIVQSLLTNSAITCSQLFEWWSSSIIGVAPEDYRILKNFTCDLDPENFNAYTDLYLSESTVWTKPTNKYRGYPMSAMGDVYDFASEARNVVKDFGDQNVTVEAPFSTSYLKSTLESLRDALKDYDKERDKEIKGHYEWVSYRLLMEGVSEALLHIANAMKNINVENARVNIWDFVANSDARQLLKILDTHPEETIALVATLGSAHLTTDGFMSYEDARKNLCTFHLNSDYWSSPNRTRFIKEICSFDPYQLLKTVTSEEYYYLVIGQRPTLTRLTPLSLSLTNLLDEALNLQTREPNLIVQSKIFSSTTWRKLSNETRSMIRNWGQSWARKHIMDVKNKVYPKMNESSGLMSDPFAKIVRMYQLVDATIELLAGGDVWQKVRAMYENSRMKTVLTLIEDIPNLVVSGVDTFVKSERLNDFVEKLTFGKLHPCDIDKYLIVPSFVRKKVLLSSLTNFCQKIVYDDRQLTLIDVLPLDAKIEERVLQTGSSEFNETYLLEKWDHVQSTVIRVATEGFKDLKVPLWWTSFKEGTLKDFLSRYNKEDPRALAHLVVKKISTILRNILNSTEYSKECSWCVTFPLEILNSQLVNHQLYSKLLCQLNRLNVSEIHDILMRDFYWNKTASMMKNYKYLSVKRSRDEFVTTLESTMHSVVDIIVNFQNDTYRDKINRCYQKFIGQPAFSRPGLYVFMAQGILDSLQKNVFILDTARNHKNIDNLSKLAEEYVPIWKSVREVVKSSEIDDIDAFLSGATINVNAILNDRNGTLCRTKLDCQNSTILYNYLSSKRAEKVFRYDPKASGYRSIGEIADRLSRSLDLDRIDRDRKQWRVDATWDLTWLKEILGHLSVVIEESGNLLDVASKIDFQDVSDVLGVPDVVDGVVNILKDKTVDKLFDGMREIIEDVKPFINDENVLDDVHRIIVALESMDIFKNLGLLDMKYVIRNMFDNWDVVRSYLVDRMGISNDVALTLSQAKIDMISVFMKERRALSLKEIICSPKKLNDMLNFNNDSINAEEVSSAICQLDDAQTQNVTITLIKNLNFNYIFNTLKDANVKSILANANLTETEGKMVLNNLGVAAELLPFFRDKLSSNMPKAEALESNVEETTDQTVSTSKFLQDSSEMLCGQPMVSDNGDLYRIISKIEDNSKEFDREELDSLPTDFCRDTYKGVVAMGGGKIIWSYVKPLLRGRILYAPNTTIVNKVMSLANKTFVEMEHFGILMDSFEKTLTSLANLSEMSDSLRELQDIMSSDVIKIAIKSFGGGNFEGGDFSDMNLSEISWRLKRSKRLITMVGMLNDLLECVLVDRIKGFRSEDEMEAEARVLMETRQFLAGVVFLDKTTRSRRSLDDELPENVVYKIRMDVDYVQSTKRLKNQFWTPGPESSFIEHLRYLRGFVQLQDAIDRAIIKTKSQRDQDWKTMTQQMPYPCWKDVPFQTTLYESQGIQVCFFFALMMCVGAAVRHIVWERESQNAMVMSVMGLKPWRNTMAWFITTFAELLIVMFSISLVLLAGKILPKSDPSLILIMMIDYSFSIVTFCYMISTICSSASLAAITTVVMFLLTFMPYVIVIAMEAVIGLGYKLLICLNMSTSFCYGCLYAARKEVQGVGLTWGEMWQESSPGDSMSLGLVLLMIAFDGCLYAIVGYLIARYTNSGKGFHDLRSRSLWWADTRSLYGRPSYLAFVNNLYFTNDVLHPSATYQDEDSDISNLTVSEKQTGVRFEGVRKVYNTDQGEVVAVDDFTLKLCEGEVTSLLGRNGAGKTTIIKMLTGMLAPTTGEICLNGEEGCKPDIGVCPQDNVLIGTLTPREHLIFYAKLKRPKEIVSMQRNVDEMLTSLELGKQEHEPVHRLSGGTKRRLCVALAFLGSPKLVILDEPGAGVDPAARRRIWRLIDQHRIGRTVILSTHHLDEADMLSDTVVVMHKGKILCTGSPLSLKMMHGRGYRLLVSFPNDGEENTDSIERKKLDTLKNVIEEVVPNAVTNEISGTEAVVTLPFQGKNGINNNIASAAKVLEDSRKIVGYSHFSLECDTLERVFLDLCSRAENGSSVTRASQDSVVTVDHVGLTVPKDDVDLIDIESTLNPSPVRQVKALLKKRAWHFRKDWLTLLAGLFLPTIFVAVAMGFSLIRPPSEDEPALVLTPKLYDTHPTYFYSIDGSDDSFLQHVSVQLHDRFGDDYAGAWQMLPNDTGICQCLDGQQVCHGVSQPIEGLLQVLPGRPALDWIVSTHQEYIEKRYGGWSLSHSNDEPLFVVWFNNKGHHALPSYLNALNEAILRASGIHGHLTTLNHPLRLSSDQLNRTTLLQHVADVGVALVLLIAFNLVAAQGSKELVRERLSEEKRILYLAGVHPVTYWTTALIWDFFVFGCSVSLAVIVFEMFGLPAYVARDNLPGICLLLFLFAWAALPFSHLAEKIFDDSSMSNMVLFCVNTFIGVASLATILVLDILGKTKTAEEARNILHNILLVFPQYALGDALVQISRNDITAQLLEKFHMDTYQSPLGWELLGLHYVYLAVIGTVLFSLNLMIECRLLPTWNKQRCPYESVQEDDDVSKERMRVEGGMSDDILQTVKLRKEYRSVYGTNVAVQNLSIGVQAGKCFGLLGTNGAGKSTTFRMLTTEIIPTAGRIILRGKELDSRPLCNGEVGYCPQSDALDGYLSPHQCLTIHGEVCGLSNVPKAVESTLKSLDLLKHAHKRVSSLSGGNKRKLCTALSVMAPVPVVLMDEPTSGMDPATKELVAKTITRMTKNQSCVILTSHSVAECENLCNRVGILAKAGLRCIGTPQHLKHKFGEGYVAFLRFRQPVSSADLRKVLVKYFPQATISSRQANAARLLVPRSQDMVVSNSFNKLKLLAEELKTTDYTLTQSSLDQVLVSFSEETENETDGSIYTQGSSNNVSNVYSSRDTIHMETF